MTDLGRLSLVTPPSVEPVSATEAKLHCKIDVSTDDTIFTRLIQAAREFAESFTHRPLITQTYDLKLDSFPCGDLWLPLPPVSSVTSVTYVDTAGVSQTWTAGTTGYLTDLPAGPMAGPARIYPAYGVLYPVTRDQPNAVTVRFVCGYGAAGTSVPYSILAAMLLLIGHWYRSREAVIVGTISGELQQGVESLLWPYKAFPANG